MSERLVVWGSGPIAAALRAPGVRRRVARADCAAGGVAIVVVDDDAIAGADGWLDAVDRLRGGIVVLVSHVGADPQSSVCILQRCGRAEQRLQRAGVRACIVRRAPTLQSLAPLLPTALREGRLEGPFRDAAWAAVDARDVADAARAAARGAVAATTTVTGPARIDLAGMARALGRLRGAPVSPVDVTALRARGLLERAGLSPTAVQSRLQLWDALASGLLAVPATRDCARLVGRAPRGFTEWAREATGTPRPARAGA